MILFLETPEEGGHTIFPFAVPTNASRRLDGVTFLGADGGGEGGDGGGGGDGDDEAPVPQPVPVRCEYPTLSQVESGAVGGLAVTPRKGDVLLLYSQRGDGTRNDAALYGACPVRKGTKTVATAWVWNRDAIYR